MGDNKAASILVESTLYHEGTHLPKTIRFQEGYIENGYFYNGVKYSKQRFDEMGNLLESETYFDNLVLRNGRPYRILHDEGYINLTELGQIEDKNYHIKDHLGNVRAVIKEDITGKPDVFQAKTYYPFGMVYTSEIMNGAFTDKTNPYLYNGKEQQEMPGLWFDYGARFYDPQLGRWHVVDSKTEKFNYESPYCYVGNNPLNYIDPDGQDKFKVEAHFKMTTGILGLGVKALGFKKYFEGAEEKQISLNISFDTDSKQLTFGAVYTDKNVEGGELSGGVIYGFSETTEKETNSEGKVGFDFKENKFVAEIESNPTEGVEAKEEKVEEGTLGIGTVTQTDGEPNKLSIGINPEVNLFLVGTGIGLNASVEKNEKE